MDKEYRFLEVDDSRQRDKSCDVEPRASTTSQAYQRHRVMILLVQTPTQLDLSSLVDSLQNFGNRFLDRNAIALLAIAVAE